ncbi:MAG: aminotransferase class III-fold pyridoxal phosphate-dependent enzyme [Planctomycetes bacterium]|jgi:acetylornithine/succinyldiaminopimelate/putrescine aminotransferase|nr:aminotransferase class III-fold pyridoxal phosphate-dependent enzyme [Planctomycetota bacterium]MCL4731562.1 aminotransferase class III-fold pyridoxal phosphate-dependent enzyme [Planctomycetota bacterium]
MNIREVEDQYILQTYAKKPIVITRGEGVHVFDDRNNRYLDLYAGHAVCSIGHCHPKLVKAISDQAKKLIFFSNSVYNDLRAEAAQLVCKNAYPASSAVFFCNSGTEANEAAIKIARRATGRPRVIAMETGFHGRTIGALSVTGNPKLRGDFPQNLDTLTDFVPFGDFEAVEAMLSPDVAAIILEPVTSVGGVRIASRKYYDSLRELCTGNGTALIFDEVQTGFGRTGKMFAGLHWNVEPDITTAAKGAGGGVPVGMVILNEAIRSAPAPGEHGCTFGGGMLAMAAVKATLEVLLEEKILAHAAEMELCVREELGNIPEVLAVTGKGLLLGIELDCPAKPVIEGLLEKRILVGGCDKPNQIRLLPPLTVQPEHIREFAAALAEVLAAARQLV